MRDFRAVEMGRNWAVVRAFTQTLDGFVWVGTEAGLYRLDGRVTVAIEAPTGLRGSQLLVTALAADEDGALWVGTQEGLWRFYRDAWHGPVHVTKDFREIRTLATWRHMVFVGLGAEVFAFNTETQTAIPLGTLDDPVEHLVATRDGGVVAMGGGACTHLGATGKLTLLETDGARSVGMTLDREGHVHVLLEDGRILTPMRPPGSRTRSWNFPERQKGIRHLVIDPAGHYWTWTNEGLWRTGDEQWDLVTAANDVGYRPTTPPLGDREGGVWMASGATVTRVARMPVTPLGPNGTRNDIVFSVTQAPDGTIWAAAFDGVLTITQENVRFLRTRTEIPLNCPRSLAPGRAGGMWIADCYKGLALLDEGQSRIFERPFRRVKLVHEARDGRVYLTGDEGGIAFLQDESWHLLQKSDPRCQEQYRESCSVAPTSIAETPDGRIWITTLGEGLLRLDGSNLKRLRTSDGLPSDRLLSTYVDDRGDLWIGTLNAGLARLSAGRVQSVSQRHGLPFEAVHGIVHDGYGALWISGSTGIARIERDQIEAVFAGTATRLAAVVFDERDGMRSARTSERQVPAALRASDGTLWFPTHAGLAVVSEPDPLQAVPLAPATVEVATDGGRFDVLTGGHIVSSESGVVSVRVTVPQFTAAHHVRTRLRIDREPPLEIGPASDGLIEPSKLSRGTHRVSVIVTRADAPHLRQEISFAIRRRALVEKPWVWLAGLLLALGAGASWQLLRSVRQRARFRAVLDERNRIARDLHDGLAQGLTAISFEVDRAANKLGGPEDGARARLERVQDLIKQVRFTARQTIWDLRLRGSEGDRPLAKELAELCSQAGLAANVAVTCDVQGTTSRRLPTTVHNEVLGIAREALTNALVHAGARSITVTLTLAPGELVLRISDDGRGFSASAPAPAGHFGLEGMRERATQVRGALTLESEPGQGTTIRLRVPL